VKLEGAFDLGVHAVISWCQFSMYDGNILYPVYKTNYFVRFVHFDSETYMYRI